MIRYLWTNLSDFALERLRIPISPQPVPFNMVLGRPQCDALGRWHFSFDDSAGRLVDRPTTCPFGAPGDEVVLLAPHSFEGPPVAASGRLAHGAAARRCRLSGVEVARAANGEWSWDLLLEEAGG